MRERLWIAWHQARHGQVVVRVRTRNARIQGLPGQTRIMVTRRLACPCGAERPRG